MNPINSMDKRLERLEKIVDDLSTQVSELFEKVANMSQEEYNEDHDWEDDYEPPEEVS